MRMIGAVISLVMVILTLGVGRASILAQTHPGDVPPLDSIHMVDALNGWAVTDESRAQTLLRTSDGGVHWVDASPLKPSGGQTVEYQVTALNSLVAWVASSDATAGASPGTTRIFRTVDAGRTWKSTAISSESAISISFVNAGDGWVLANEGGAAGSMEVDIYHSTDGGQTWSKVESTRARDESSGLPFAGDKTGLTFLNATKGWVTGSIAADDWMYLFVTVDAGRTWRQQGLPVPPQLTPHWNDWTMPPTFFTARDGILPVLYSTQGKANGNTLQAVVCYVTHDGGTTWTYTTPVAITPGNEFSTSFVDVAHGWVTDGTALYATSDGGRTWTRSRPAALLAGVKQLVLISRRVGLAVRRTPPFLVKTADGGRTWAPVVYTISRQRARGR